MNPKLLHGNLEPIVIKLLLEQGELYGYEITTLVKGISNMKLVLTEGALYPILHKLEAKGTITSETRKVDNRFRKYYRLSPDKKKETTAQLAEMDQYIQTLIHIFNPKLT